MKPRCASVPPAAPRKDDTGPADRAKGRKALLSHGRAMRTNPAHANARRRRQSEVIPTEITTDRHDLTTNRALPRKLFPQRNEAGKTHYRPGLKRPPHRTARGTACPPPSAGELMPSSATDPSARDHRLPAGHRPVDHPLRSPACRNGSCQSPCRWNRSPASGAR